MIFSIGLIIELFLFKIKGIEGFKGEMFYLVCWKYDYDLMGKWVVVIGIGVFVI